MKRKRGGEEQVEVNCGVDRLSCLPYDILGRILSFLDTKSAIRTSLLSRQYQDAWASSTTLHFKLPGLNLATCKYSHGFPGLNAISHSFETNVSHVLQRRKDYKNLESFRLSLHIGVTSIFIEECIHYAVQRNIHHLRIRANTKDHRAATLPKLLLTSSSLITLHLNDARRDSIELPKSVVLPNLKILRLKNFEFSAKNYNGEVFTGCPNLEELVLVKCLIRCGDELKVLDVNCLNLKKLEIRYWKSPWEDMISVNTPNLEHFKLHGFITRIDFRTDMPSLDRACIELSAPVGERMMTTSETLFSMLHQMHHVNVLKISPQTMKVIDAFPELRDEKMPGFEILKIVNCKEDIPMYELKDALAFTFPHQEDSGPSVSSHTVEIPLSLKNLVAIHNQMVE
ncbi:hypothetical protein ABFS83_14G318800 [Erythranthe nasuta]